MDRPLLDKLCDYTILNYKFKHFFQPKKTVLISALIREQKKPGNKVRTGQNVLTSQK